jgi:hypothetical protein
MRYKILRWSTSSEFSYSRCWHSVNSISDVGMFNSRGVLKHKSAMDTPHPKNNGERKSWVSGTAWFCRFQCWVRDTIYIVTISNIEIWELTTQLWHLNVREGYGFSLLEEKWGLFFVLCFQLICFVFINKATFPLSLFSSLENCSSNPFFFL